MLSNICLLSFYNDNLIKIKYVFSVRRQYPPLSLYTLQKMIDLNRIDVTKPIDLSTLCNTGLYNINPEEKHFGVNLIDEVRFI